MSSFCSVRADRRQGILKPVGMITSKIGMHEVAEKGFKALVEEKDKHVKILIEVNPEVK